MRGREREGEIETATLIQRVYDTNTHTHMHNITRALSLV